jgi:hypothetical protein
MVMGC